ncbi:MAG: class I SAM-dependent methyltransferase, partial [Chloroflexi bacterium]|nr:class I SAM-dependent methyltransferase [Chloroflexota bacterium]
SAIDNSAAAISYVRDMAEAAGLPGDRFRNEEVDSLSFQDGEFDVIICNAVLHFSRDEEHFNAQLGELWRVLGAGGLLFSRLASSIGLEGRVQHIDGRHYLLPDGTRRFLVDEAFLLDATDRLGGKFLEPIKTVNVQGMRCMTTWVVSKRGE